MGIQNTRKEKRKKMYLSEKILLTWILVSFFLVWKEGLRANIDPDLGGSPKNRFNTAAYCCIYWKSEKCYKELQRKEPKQCSSQGPDVSCYPKEPTFDLYGCEAMFEGPEHAETCNVGDVWPDCVMRKLRVNPGHKLSLVTHAFALVLLFKGNSFWSFLFITILTLA
jgi:hypothetical protein